MGRRRKQTGNQPAKDSVVVINEQKDLSLKAASVRRLIYFILEKKQVAGRGITVHLVSKRKISLLHKHYFNDPSFTDCISVAFGGPFLGEVFVCPKVAIEYNPKDPFSETALYIIHGILHLLGYDDRSAEGRRKMGREQMRLLTLVKRCPEILF